MNFQLIGVNHKTAPVEVREQLAIPDGKLRDALQNLLAISGVHEGMILSTCNRVEVLAHTANGSTDLRDFLRALFGLSPSTYEPHLYEYREQDAVRHVFRVTSSLDSMVVGEPQILGQVKEAYATARALGAVQSYLDLLLTRAFAVAKRVRTETAVGSSHVSVASCAVDLAGKIFGSLNGKQVCLVGAGKMSEIAARHLLARGAGPIFVANRTYERAQVLAGQFGGRAIRFDALYDHCEQADIVITSTGAPVAIFRREHGERFLNRRKNRPMFFIDIAVPRDVDPEMNKLDGIFVYDIDDLQEAVTSHAAGRVKEAERAEGIIEDEVERFQARLRSLHVVPTIVSLQDYVETIRQAELDRVRGKLGRLSPEQEQALDALTHGIVNKILHTPITRLKSAVAGAEDATLLDAFKKIFNLQDKTASNASAEKSLSNDATSGSRSR
ncbi:MAG TPA: glutamyl-tRNA reductase [Terriglobales bacterium]|nr:glutamyl-tRNA reductase [Terriglobales bacterium]